MLEYFCLLNLKSFLYGIGQFCLIATYSHPCLCGGFHDGFPEVSMALCSYEILLSVTNHNEGVVTLSGTCHFP